MFEQLRGVVAGLEELVQDLEPGLLECRDALRALELFTKAEHLAAAGKALVAARVAAVAAHRESGHRSAGELLAAVSGTTVGAAESTLRAVGRLDDLPATDQAFRAGELSEVQTREISYAAGKDPEAEARLVGMARRRRPLKGLRQECARVVAASVEDDEAWARELHESRSMTMWHERGHLRADLRLAPERAIRFRAAVEAETDAVFREARASGRREPRWAYMADALANLVDRGPRKPVDARLDVSDAALERGHLIGCERCEIPGLGPIPVTAAKKLLADARVTMLVRDDTDRITHVSSTTRTVPVKLRKWLEATYPVCGRQGCDNPARVIDHVHPFAQGGVLDEHNAWRLCDRCDDLKTYRGWKVVGAPGHRDLVPPDDPRPAAHPRPAVTTDPDPP